MPRPFSRDRDRPPIDGYEDLELIGRGGYSRVYRARQPAFDRAVAVKVITAAIADDDVDRFADELRITGRLDGHPNVIRVYDSGRTRAGRPYLSMELLEDGSYGTWLRTHGPLRVADVLSMGVRVAGALHAAHERGIVHRDVKPQNVLRSPFVGPVLADFGIAGLLERRTGAAAGSEAFSVLHAAPEVLAGGRSTPASDLYSLASTLYELLTGAAPFHDPDRPGVLDVLARVDAGDVAPIDRPDLPGPAAQAIVALLAPNVADRPGSGVEMAARLQAIEHDLGLPVTPIPGYEGATGRGGRGRRPASPPPATPPPGEPEVSMEDPAVHTIVPGQDAPTAPPRSGGPNAPRDVIGAHQNPADPTDTIDRRAPVRPPRPGEDEPPPPRRWPRRLALGLVVLAVLGGLGFGARTLLDDDTDGANPSPTTTTTAAPAPATTDAPAGPPPCPDVEVPSLASPTAAQPAPTGISVEEGPDLTVRWTDRTGGAAGHVVFLRCTAGDATDVRAVAAVEAGATSAAIPVPAGHRVCITVGAVQPGAGTRLPSGDEQFVCNDT